MTAEITIPFNRPWLSGNEISYILEAMAGGHVSGNGSFTRRCESFLEDALGVPRVLLTTSCTDALEMSALLLRIEPGDEVILPSFTFVSTANAFALRGAQPVFCDVRPDTLNLDESRLEALIGARTRAIVAVHYAGVGCAMDRIGEIAAAAAIPVVEDNAHGLFGTWRGRALGTFGVLATLSFHETKNFTCGEGGALVINDPELIARAEVIREKGTDRARFFKGEVDRYSWVDLGSSHLPADLLAAFLLAQLESRDAIGDRRRKIWEGYAVGLEEWAREHGVRLPLVPPEARHPHHLFHLLMPDERSRDGLIGHLRAEGILSVFHYLPLHLSPMGRRFGGGEGDCPVTEDVSRRLLRLPFYNDLEAAVQERVVAAILGFRP